jgi:hypothetical protein
LLQRGVEDLGLLYRIRRAAYALADISIKTEEHSPEEVVAEILERLAM